MMETTLVHEEWPGMVELVPSTGHGGKSYRVSYGTVSWTRTPEDMRRALIVFMQRGDTENFEEAKSLHEIQWDVPAHILEEDLDAVMAAMRRVRGRVQERVR